MVPWDDRILRETTRNLDKVRQGCHRGTAVVTRLSDTKQPLQTAPGQKSDLWAAATPTPTAPIALAGYDILMLTE